MSSFGWSIDINKGRSATKWKKKWDPAHAREQRPQVLEDRENNGVSNSLLKKYKNCLLPSWSVSC